MRAQGVTQGDIQAQWPQLAEGDALAGAINALLQGHRLELFHNESGHLVYRASSAANAQKCSSQLKDLLCYHVTCIYSADLLELLSVSPREADSESKAIKTSNQMLACQPLLTREREQKLCCSSTFDKLSICCSATPARRSMSLLGRGNVTVALRIPTLDQQKQQDFRQSLKLYSMGSRYKGLTKEELLVFQTIQATGNTGLPCFLPASSLPSNCCVQHDHTNFAG